MANYKAIRFETLRDVCAYIEPALFLKTCDHPDNDTTTGGHGNCKARNCPIWKRLRKAEPCN